MQCPNKKKSETIYLLRIIPLSHRSKFNFTRTILYFKPDRYIKEKKNDDKQKQNKTTITCANTAIRVVVWYGTELPEIGLTFL